MDELRKIVKELAEKTNELRESQKKTDKEIDKTRKMVVDLTNGWGRFTEGLIIPSLEKIVSLSGMTLTNIFQRARKRRNGKEMEIDILGIGEKGSKQLVMAVEAKTFLRKKDIDDFTSSMEKFFNFFDEYRDKEVVCYVAFMNCEKGAVEYAENQGLYVMGASDDVMRIMNKKGFKPRIFKV